MNGISRDATTGLEVIETMLDRLTSLRSPDRDIDLAIFDLLERKPLSAGAAEPEPTSVPFYTQGQDEAVLLIKTVLPGWWWSCGSCCVSDDARIAPDFNCPVHGERLKREFFPLEAGSELDAGFDVDRRPPGNVAIALLTALFMALSHPAVHRAWLDRTSRTGQA